jgi:glucose-specific phosphotransferase system IIA component
MDVVLSPLTGVVVPLDEVPDEVFAQRILGDGLAVRPSGGEVVAPADGRIAKLFAGGHAIVVETADGVQVLVHVGIDTVRLRGCGFTVRTAEGQRVRAGDPLVRVDVAALVAEGIELVSPVVLISGHAAAPLAAGLVRAGDPLLEVRPPAVRG